MRPRASFPRPTPRCAFIAALGPRSLVRRVRWPPYPKRRGEGASSRQTLGGERESGHRVYSGVATRGLTVPPFATACTLGRIPVPYRNRSLRPSPGHPGLPQGKALAAGGLDGHCHIDIHVTSRRRVSNRGALRLVVPQGREPNSPPLPRNQLVIHECRSRRLAGAP